MRSEALSLESEVLRVEVNQDRHAWLDLLAVARWHFKGYSGDLLLVILVIALE